MAEEIQSHHHTKGETAEENEHDSASCGCGSCSPSWARRFANPNVFVAHAGIMFGLNVAVSTYIGGALSAIERAFRISSSYAGGVVIVDDVVNLSLVFLVSYFGHNSHRPRIISIGGILSGIGLIISAMPHYVTEPLDPAYVIFGSNQFSSSMSSGAEGLCTTANTDFKNISDATECDDNNIGQSGVIGWLVLGRVVSGAGVSSITTLTLSYLDDSVSKERLTTYTAFLFTLVAIGAPCGFFLSSQTTSMYVDFDRVPAESIPDISQNDPRWIGAWWLGFLACGFLWIIISVPMCLYPKQMPGSTNQSSKDNCIQEKTIEDGENGSAKICKHFLHHIFGVLKALKRLLTNVPLMALCIGSVVDAASYISLGSFLIKTMEVQFVISSSSAATIFGGLLLISSVLSQTSSGFLCRLLKLETYGCAVYILICNIGAALLMFSLIFVGCNNRQVAGVNAPYMELLATPTPSNEVLIDAMCNSNCSCPSEIFRPICGSDGLTYVSPCHAGCTTSTVSYLNGSGYTDNSFLTETNITYHDCQCLLSNISKAADSIPSGTATSGQCIGDCSTGKLIVFLVLIFFGFAFGTMVANPFVYVNMRLVDERDKSVALALRQVISNTFGSFPTPVYFGAIINSACILWQRTCGERGSCWLYDIESYRVGFFGTLFALRVFFVFCTIVVVVSVKRQASRAAQNNQNKPSYSSTNGDTKLDEFAYNNPDVN